MARQKKSPYYPLAASSKGTKLMLPHKVRFVQRDLRLQPFHWLFCKIVKNARTVCKREEGRKSIDILKLLDEIIPLQYFGTKKNKKLFYRIVKLILTRSAYECIYMRQIIKGFDLKAIPWLSPILNRNGVNAKALCQRHLFEQKKSPYYPLAASSKGTKLMLPHKVRFVQRDLRLQPFHWLFCKIVKNARTVCKREEGRKSIDILKLLDEIIPLQYFGTKKNKKLFYRIVKLILTRSAYECIYMRQIIKGFDLKAIPWLSPILNRNGVNAKALCQRHLFEAQVWLLEKVVKPIISRFYASVRKGQTHEIELVSRRKWLSFQKKVINGLESRRDMIHEPKTVHPRGILQIRPKNEYSDPNDFRPIMRLIPEMSESISYVTKRRLREQNKNIISTIYAAAGKMCLTKTSLIYPLWKHYVAVTEGQNIYGVKIDVKDAFGNIKIDVLCKILKEQRYENKIPLNITTFITNRIQHQFITIDTNKKGSPKKMWKWQHGLLQGDRFSSALCQLYMSYLDSLYLNKFYKPTTLLHRTVDDYFFCSTSKTEAKEFIDIMNSVHTLNINKTESNLPNYGHNEIGYCGQVFNMNTKQVKSLYNFKKYTEIRHRFRFWNKQRPIYYRQQEQKTIETFLRKPMMLASNRYRFKSMELNTVFNNETTLMQNYFEAMILLAFKFDASVMAIYYIIKDFSLVTTVIKKTVYKYSQNALKQSTQNKGQYCTDLLSLQVFMKIGLQAFILVLKKRTLYQKHKLIDCLFKYMRKIYVKNLYKVNFKNFKTMPKMFNNIRISRRLPH